MKTPCDKCITFSLCRNQIINTAEKMNFTNRDRVNIGSMMHHLDFMFIIETVMTSKCILIKRYINKKPINQYDKRLIRLKGIFNIEYHPVYKRYTKI